MTVKNALSLLITGLIIWIVGTIYYAYSGAAILETTSARYWSAFIASPIVSAAICVAILRRRRIAAESWASAMLLLAIPGMIGEAIVLTNFPLFIPRLQAATAGRYGAFLFVTYALVLSLAVLITFGAFPTLAGPKRSSSP